MRFGEEKVMQLSIIIPVYNCERQMGQTIIDIAVQMIDSIELLLIDDGSTDKTESVCQKAISEYSHLNIRYFFKENGGVSSARNFGINKAIGEYVVFVDADDRIEKNYISSILKMIELSPDLCQFGYYSQIDGQRTRTENQFNELPEGMTEDLRPLHYTYIYMKNNEVWNKVFRREIIEKERIRFDPKLRYGEDLIFCMEYSKHVKTMLISRKVLYGYIKTTESVTFQFKSNFITDSVVVYKYIMDYFSKDYELERIAAEYIAIRLIERYQDQKENRVLWQREINSADLYNIVRTKITGYSIENQIRLLQLRAITNGNDFLYGLASCLSRLYRIIRKKR